MTVRLRLDGVTCSLGGRVVLDGCSFSVCEGEVLALVGPNGAGKSTALRVAAGLLPSEGGTVELDGVELRRWHRKQLARVLAFLPQSPTIPPLFPVRDVVAMGRAPYLPFLGSASAADRAVVEQCMVVAGVDGFASRRAGELSGGEQQRVALARALAQEPGVLLLDEPTANLDLRYQETILGLVRDAARDRGLACLVVIHDLALAAQFCDRVALLADGRVAAEGRPEEALDADHLSAIYGAAVRIIPHPDTGGPVVVHALAGDRDAGKEARNGSHP